MSSFASVSPGRTDGDAACRCRIRCRRTGSAEASSCGRQCPTGIELRLGADARRTSGESRELFSYVAGDPTRRRLAGGETLDQRCVRRGDARTLAE